MSAWQGKSQGNKLGYQIFVWILKNAGVFPAYFLLNFVAFYFFLFNTKSSRQVYQLYHQKLGYTRFSSLAKVYKNFRLLGQCIIDKVVVMSGIPNKFTYHFDGEDNLRTMVAMQKGGLLLSAHIGNWDIAGYLLKRLEVKINIVIFDGEDEQIKEYLASVTGEKTVKVIVIKADLSHIYELSEAFKNNELVCIHADRFLEGNKTISTNFLGQPARFPMGPFILAASFKVPVSYVFAIKEKNLHYHFYASEIKNYQHLERKIMMQQLLDEFAVEMEMKVKQCPEQWFNYYDFWA